MNRKYSLAPTKRKTLIIKHMDRQQKWHSLKEVYRAVWVFRRKLIAMVSRMDILSPFLGNNIFMTKDSSIFKYSNVVTKIP